MKIIAKLACATGVLATALCLNMTPSAAGLYGHSRWCAVTNSVSDAMNWDCEYNTVEDCTPAVLTGIRGYCALNPFWTAATDQH